MDTLFAALIGVPVALHENKRPRIRYEYDGVMQTVPAYDLVDASRMKKVLKDEHNIDAEVLIYVD